MPRIEKAAVAAKVSLIAPLIIANCLNAIPAPARAGACETAALNFYCTGVTMALSGGAEKSSPDLSTALKVKSSEYGKASRKDGYASLSQKYLTLGVQDASKSTDAKIMKRLLGICVDSEEKLVATFVSSAATDCETTPR